MVLRVGGLASGIDVDSLVRDLMRAERMPLDKLTQERQIWEWKQDEYREINSSLRTLRDQAFDLKLQGAFLSKSASTSNGAAVGVTASNNTIEGIYSVTVNNLAEGVSKGSTAQLANIYDGDVTNSLYQQFQTDYDARSLTANDDITFNLNGKDFTFNLGTTNILQMVSEINNSDLGVKASYDTSLNRFFLTTTTTGSGSEITVSADSSNFLSTGVDTGILKLNLDTGSTYNGVDASIDLGDATGLTFAANTVIVNGLTLNLKEGAGATSTITVTKDTDTVFNSINGFIDSYNEIVGKINDKLRENKYRDYLPLTEEQKKAMSDNEIELWEKKARSGLLSNDSMLNGIINKVRSAAASIVDGLNGYKSMADIGITTKPYQYLGQLEINKGKLMEALNQDIDGVMQLFTETSDTAAEKGIAVRLYDEVVNGIKRVSDQAGSGSSFSLVDLSFIGKRLTSLDRKMADWEKRLNRVEDRYWKQFTAMEQALQRMNAQSAWLAAQMGGQQQ